MIIDWVYKATLDISILIGLILLLRVPVRRLLGANVLYWLWVLPVIRVLLPYKLQRPTALTEITNSANLDSTVSVFQSPSADVLVVPQALPLLGLWYTGIVLCVLFQLTNSWRFRQTLTTQSYPFKQTTDKIRRLIKSSGLASDRVLVTDLVDTPFVTGLLKPKIFLPTNFEKRFSADAGYWILKHELAHIRRKDLWLQLISETFRALFWFNPIVHIAIKCFREDQEYACDQSVISKCDSKQRYQYGKALLSSTSPLLVPSALTFFSKSKERYIMLGKHRNSKLNSAMGLSLCFIVGLFAFTSAPQSIAQSEQRPAFDALYDPDAPVRITGKIIRIDYGEFFSLIHVDAERDDGSVIQWVVEGGSYTDMHEKNLDSNALFPGRPVTITGYRTIDRSCETKCRVNGRDITFEDN